MRTAPICKHVSSQLNTAVSVYDSKYVLKEHYSPDKEFHDILTDYPSSLRDLLEDTKEHYPVFSFINGYINYAHFSTPDGIYLIGPFHLLFSESGVHTRHTLTLDGLDPVSFAKIPDAFPPFAMNYILLLFNIYQQTEFSTVECYEHNFNQDFIHHEVKTQTTAVLFSNREHQEMHNPYDQELRLLRSIEEGDIGKLKLVWEESDVGQLGITAADPVRNGKNMAIYIITASGRAAIRGGLPAEYVFSLTDSYSQQIEELKDMLLLQPLVHKIEMSLAQMVANLKRVNNKDYSGEHPVIRQSKNYVFKHLHNKLTVQEIADKLHVHPNFLSSLFRTHEGVSLYQYILLQKIDLAKNLLTYSNYSFIDIANYLDFSSQSHLNTRFKNATGMTLKQYRDAFKKESFD